MRVTSQRARRALILTVAAAAGAALIAGCGSSSSSTKPTNLSMSISEKGKAASFQAPKTAKAGLVDVSFKNNGKAPHGVQLIQYTGNHTSQDVLKNLGSNSNKIPDWIRGQGGTDTVPGGKSTSATVNLPAGNYVVVDSAAIGGGGPSSGPPATANLKLSGGSTGDLPSTPATISAENPAKDKYKWSISGLKSGENNVTFNSKGKKADHLIIAVPVKGKAPPLSQIKKDLASNGPPPKWADFKNTQSSSVLDGGLSQTLSFNLPKSGQYVFFCPLHDRDGKGKAHDQEGLLSVQTVK